MSNIQIKHRYTGAVLFEGASGMTMRETLENATEAKANLSDANLRDANLRDANLIGANLIGANLRDANLIGANLRGANLIGANLIGANLIGANLIGANLRGAKFSEDKLLIGDRPFFSIGPIGSRCSMVSLWLTDKGPMVKAGCFTGSMDKFIAACEKTHGDSIHGKEYAMAILMMESHAALWTPEVSA